MQCKYFSKVLKINLNTNAFAFDPISDLCFVAILYLIFLILLSQDTAVKSEVLQIMLELMYTCHMTKDEKLMWRIISAPATLRALAG